MRNTVVQALPAGATLIIKVDPPMNPDERHYTLVPQGRDSVVVRVIDTAHVELINQSAAFALVIFGVTKIPTLSPALHEMVATLFSKVRT